MIAFAALMQHAATALADDNKEMWKTSFMGLIPALETVYLIATPYKGEQMEKSKIWIAPKGDITKIYEPQINKIEVMRNGSVSFATEYGTFIFPADGTENKRFAYGGGEVLRIHEYIILN